MKYQFVYFPAVFLYYLIMAACLLPETHDIRVVFGLPPDFADGGMDTLVFGKWLLITEVPLLVNGLILERGSQIELFSRIRLKKKTGFRSKLTLSCMKYGVLWAAVLTVGATGFTDIKTASFLFPLTLSNLFLWEAVQVMIYFCFKKAFWSGAAILLFNGGSCVAGLYLRSIQSYMPAFWGMLCRSSQWSESSGLPMNYFYMIAANLAVTAVCIIFTSQKEEE